MQSFSRAVSRAAWGARLGAIIDTPASRPHVMQSPSMLKSRPCLLCRARSVGFSIRLYATDGPIPARGASSTPKSHSQPSADTSPSAAAAGDAAETAAELPSTTESRRSIANQRFSSIMDNLQSRLLTASHTLNEITGYSGIEAIKEENAKLELALWEAHDRVRTARQAYRTSNTRRATTQREVTTLLARKDTWSPTDLERFTELYRQDHVVEGEVTSAQEALTEAEAEEQSLNQRLNTGILKRYHEEQIWSDRIRRASTWGTWGLMGMNFLLFLVLQFVAEPWRRRRLVRGVVAEEKEVLLQVRSELEAVRAVLAERETTAVLHPHVPIQETPPAPAAVDPATLWKRPEETWARFLLRPSSWKMVASDLISDRQAGMRMKDISLIALEGVVTGAAIVGSIAWAVARRT